MDALAARHVAVHEDVVTAVLAGMAGYFADAARRPAPPGLPTVRAFQQAQADSTLAWVRRRIG